MLSNTDTESLIKQWEYMVAYLYMVTASNKITNQTRGNTWLIVVQLENLTQNKQLINSFILPFKNTAVPKIENHYQ